MKRLFLKSCLDPIPKVRSKNYRDIICLPVASTSCLFTLAEAQVQQYLVQHHSNTRRTSKHEGVFGLKYVEQNIRVIPMLLCASGCCDELSPCVWVGSWQWWCSWSGDQKIRSWRLGLLMMGHHIISGYTVPSPSPTTSRTGLNIVCGTLQCGEISKLPT